MNKQVSRLLNELQQRAAVLDRKLRRVALSDAEFGEKKGIRFVEQELNLYRRKSLNGESDEVVLKALYEKIHKELEEMCIKIGISTDDIKMDKPLFAFLKPYKKAADVLDCIAKEHGWFSPYLENIKNYSISEVQTDEKGKSYVMLNGDKAFVEKLADGTQYVTLQKNPYLTEEDTAGVGAIDVFLLNHFVGRIGDAAQAVRDGYAHCIIGPKAQLNVFSGEPHPAILLDPVKGVHKRAETLKDLNSLKFGWGLTFGCKNSFGCARFVSEDHDLCVLDGTPAFFATRAESVKLRDDILQEAEDFLKGFFKDEKKRKSPVRKLLSKKKATEGEESKSVIDRYLDAVGAKHLPFITENVADKMLIEDEEGKEIMGYDPNKWSEIYYFEIVQTAKQVE